LQTLNAFPSFFFLELSRIPSCTVYVLNSGKVWPGDCVLPDFTSKRARAWWASLVRDFISNGVDGIWNDMNEPAVADVNDFHYLYRSSYVLFGLFP